MILNSYCALILKIYLQDEVYHVPQLLFLSLYYCSDSFEFSSFHYQANIVLTQNLCNMEYSYQHMKCCYNVRISNFEFATVYMFHSYSIQLVLLYVYRNHILYLLLYLFIGTVTGTDPTFRSCNNISTNSWTNTEEELRS